MITWIRMKVGKDSEKKELTRFADELDYLWKSNQKWCQGFGLSNQKNRVAI